MINILFITFFISKIFSQGMYIDSEDIRTAFSLNMQLSSFVEVLENGDEKEERYYSIGLSSVLKSKNQYEINLYKKERSKLLEAAYTFYIKPKFYLNMNCGFSYKYIKENDNTRYSEYLTKFSLYGNNKNNSKEKPLNFYPFFTYEYIYRNNSSTYDVYKVGVSVLFNDIGIEPTYSFISKDVNEMTLKIYLWEFGS